MANSKTVENITEVVVVRAAEITATQGKRTATTVASKTAYANKIVYITGTLAEILAVRGIPGAYQVQAKPSDVHGCTAQYFVSTDETAQSGWTGFLGTFADDTDIANRIPVTNTLAHGAWILFGTNVTGTSIAVFQP